MGSLGDLNEVEKRIIFNSLQESLSKYYKLTSQRMYERAEEEAFQKMDIDECTEDQCIAIIQELLQVENFFNIEILKTNNFSQIKLTKTDIDSNRVVRTISFSNCGVQEINENIEELVESISDDDSLEKVECEKKSRDKSPYSSSKSTFNLDKPIAIRFGFVFGNMLALDYAYDEKQSFGILQFNYDDDSSGIYQTVELSAVYMLYGLKFTDNLLIMPIYGVGNNTGKTNEGSKWDLDISTVGVQAGYNYIITDTAEASITTLVGYNIVTVTQENNWISPYSDKDHVTLETSFRQGYTNFLIALLLNYTFK